MNNLKDINKNHEIRMQNQEELIKNLKREMDEKLAKKNRRIDLQTEEIEELKIQVKQIYKK